MIRLDFKRGAALRVALGAVVAAMCATPAAEAKIFNGKICQTWREARLQRTAARCEVGTAGTTVAPPN